MLAMLLWAALCVQANVITVNGDGSAQFTTIQAAIDAAAPGDVIEVQPGTYTEFTLQKPLTLLGPETGVRPFVAHRSVIDGASSFSLAGFRLGALRVNGVGQGVIEECDIGPQPDEFVEAELVITACNQLMVARSTVAGMDDGGMAAEVGASRVAFTACSIMGGDGMTSLDGAPGGDGGQGLIVGNGSDVQLTATTVGGGGCGLGGSYWTPHDGSSGDGMIVDHSTLVARGLAQDDWIGTGWSTRYGTFGHSIIGVAGTVSMAGIEVYPEENALYAGGVLHADAQPQPFLDEVTGSSGLQRLIVQGPAGAAAWLCASVQPGEWILPKLDQSLWMTPDTLGFAHIVTAGYGAGVSIAFEPHPTPALLGAEIVVQAVFPALASPFASGKIVVTNPAAAVVEF
jgi:hypothetical protein